jgi:hypothetical protein
MTMPNRHNSAVEDHKITDYLLNPNHKDGAPKEKFFTMHGFSLQNIEVLRTALLNHAMNRDIAKQMTSPHGDKYVLICEVETPDERNPCIKSIWIINHGELNPRLISAYPKKNET